MSDISSGFVVPSECSNPHVSSFADYQRLYEESTSNPSAFWLRIARELHFEEFSGNGLAYNFDVEQGPVYTRFLAGSKTNMAYNCLERNVKSGRHQAQFKKKNYFFLI